MALTLDTDTLAVRIQKIFVEEEALINERNLDPAEKRWAILALERWKVDSLIGAYQVNVHLRLAEAERKEAGYTNPALQGQLNVV